MVIIVMRKIKMVIGQRIARMARKKRCSSIRIKMKVAMMARIHMRLIVMMLTMIIRKMTTLVKMRKMTTLVETREMTTLHWHR